MAYVQTHMHSWIQSALQCGCSKHSNYALFFIHNNVCSLWEFIWQSCVISVQCDNISVPNEVSTQRAWSFVNFPVKIKMVWQKHRCKKLKKIWFNSHIPPTFSVTNLSLHWTILTYFPFHLYKSHYFQRWFILYWMLFSNAPFKTETLQQHLAGRFYRSEIELDKMVENSLFKITSKLILIGINTLVSIALPVSFLIL